MIKRSCNSCEIVSDDIMRMNGQNICIKCYNNKIKPKKKVLEFVKKKVSEDVIHPEVLEGFYYDDYNNRHETHFLLFHDNESFKKWQENKRCRDILFPTRSIK
jgi:hypothetical protein